jgi:hypothetical protein
MWVRTGFIWLWIGTSIVFLRTQKLKSGFRSVELVISAGPIFLYSFLYRFCYIIIQTYAYVCHFELFVCFTYNQVTIFIT